MRRQLSRNRFQRLKWLFFTPYRVVMLVAGVVTGTALERQWDTVIESVGRSIRPDGRASAV
ncbi:hypothetical protein GCM10008094_31260 [Aidingimonas halophila]|nr:hypothetical protein GCM10008094_31260 [Aidingimonas halophila]